MTSRLRTIFLPAIAILLLGAATAQAQYPYYAGTGYGCCGAGGFRSSPGFVPLPPYFAMHPPVYYSYPAARPYGYSPFPYPGTEKAPAAEAATTAEIINPFVESTDMAAEAPRGRTASSRRLIVNPFVKPTREG